MEVASLLTTRPKFFGGGGMTIYRTELAKYEEKFGSHINAKAFVEQHTPGGLVCAEIVFEDKVLQGRRPVLAVHLRVVKCSANGVHEGSVQPFGDAFFLG